MIVYKYLLNGPATGLVLPYGAQLLTAQMQGDQLVLWALVDPREVRTVRRLIVSVNTGAEFDFSLPIYIATATSPTGIVWHVFEVFP